MAASDRIDELKKRYDENPRRFFASLANEYRKAGDLAQAITLCETHLADQPSNMNGHVVYGQALFESGRYDEAQVTFETAIQLDPENLIALRHLGDISAANGSSDKAREWYERVLDADPRNNEIIELIARLATDAPAPPAPALEPQRDVSVDASPAEVSPHDARTVEFTPPTAATPVRAATPVSMPAVAATPVMPTPVVPIESVQTSQTPVVSMPPVSSVPSRESIGLMDLALDFDTPSEAPPAAAQAETGDDPLFPTFEEVQLGAAIESPDLGESTMLDAFADPTPAELLAWKPAVVEPAAPAPEVPASVPAVDVSDITVVTTVVAEPVVEQAHELEHAEIPASARLGSSAPSEPAPPFVTETMAELYLQQGFTAEALEVYRQLSAANPDDENLKARVRGLEPEPAPSVSIDSPGDEPVYAVNRADVGDELIDLDRTPVVSRTPVQGAEVEREPVMPPAAEAESPSARSYFAGLASRRAVQGGARSRTPYRGVTPHVPTPRVSSPSLTASSIAAASLTSFEELFPNSAIAPEDEHIALAFARVAGAVEMGTASVQGKPTAPAATELSLDSVFREADARGTGAVPRQSQTLRFDQFFATAPEEASPAPANSAPAGEPGSPAELQQFQSWLSGLKKP